MSLTQPLVPAIATTILEFPENPKALILRRCKTTRDLKQVHAHLIKTRGSRLGPAMAENLLESVAILTSATTMDYAVSIFRRIDCPDSKVYNVMIRGFSLKNSPDKAVLLFKEMKENYVEPDEFSFACTLKACSKLRGMEEGKQIHALILKSGLRLNDGFVGNSLIHMYGNCGESKSAGMVFDEMPERDVYTWNALFSGYCKDEKWDKVISLFGEMRKMGVAFNGISFISVLTACGRLADIEVGEWIAAYVENNSHKKNVSLVTSLVDMYAKCGKLESARRLFDEMKKRDVVAWSVMISGYSQARRCKEALEVFREMQLANVEPNEVTMVSLLSSCAVLGAFETGKWMHFYIKRQKMKLTITLGTALIDFYAKCGSLENAIEVFDQMPLKNVFSWTVLIQGLANNGQGKRALEFFQLMRERNIEPNAVTFIGVLSACCHAGLVDEGREFFLSMTKDFGIEPRMEHYGCMVDILGRAGLIREAYQFIQNMPIRPNSVIWRTLLASCRAHRNVDIGEESVKSLVKLEPMHSGDYILLSNIYASVGMLEEAQRVRNQMKEKGIKKPPGCTLIELDGEIYEFFAEDNTNPHSYEIYRATESIIKKIKSAGYVPNTIDARLDAEEDEKEAAVSHHSEKLAIAFGIIRTSPGTTIRISKNLRVCTDCHNATKMISKVYGREIVVRDRNRFHHFKDGVCSCNDYW